MTLDQSAFIDALTNEHGLDDCSMCETPMNTTFPDTDTSDRLTPDLHTIYRSKLGSLQFLAALTRPDISAFEDLAIRSQINSCILIGSKPMVYSYFMDKGTGSRKILVLEKSDYVWPCRF